MQNRKEQGFTLIEMVVVVAIIAALAAILVPVVSEELSSSEESKALGDCQRLAAAVTQFIADTRYFPTGTTGAQTLGYLTGQGTVPTLGTGFDGTAGDLFDFICNGTTNGGPRFAGPYAERPEADPWGNAYVVNVHGYYASENVWVISAGPNGTINTASTDYELQGDDIGILID